MAEPKPKPITDDNQAMPHATRMSFLQGVMDEANEHGYSKHATGRLFVLALRAWERR